MKKITTLLALLVVLFLLAFISGCTSDYSFKKENISTAISADGSTISFGTLGQGEITLIFVHCWTCNHEFWRSQIDYFAKKHKVVWLDLAGHGLSSSRRKDYTMPAFGEDVAAVVKKIDADNIILVGHSMGGPVAIEAAKLLGNKVIGIIGVDTFYIPFEYPKSEAGIDGFVKPFKDDYKVASEQMVRSMFTSQADPDLISSNVKQMSVADKELGISAMYEIFRWNAKHVPHELERYSTILRNINAAPTGKELALHNSVLHISGVGHFMAQVKPDEFNEVLDKIVTELQSH